MRLSNLNLDKTKEDNMKPKHIMAEQSDGHEELWNSVDDQWSRKAKYPIRPRDVSNLTTWEIGETVLFEGIETQIVIPTGPHRTIGIKINGKTKMVSESKVSKLDETMGVTGSVKSIEPLNRIKQLAGIEVPVQQKGTSIQPGTVVQENEPPLIEEDATDMFEQLYKANFAGEYKNNPAAARIATIGQILVGLATQVKNVTPSVSQDLVTKLNVVPGLGALLLKQANTMTKDTVQGTGTPE